MKLTQDQVARVAKLANLPLTAEELDKYSDQLTKILDYIDLLNSVDTSNVEPTFNVTGLSNVMRADKLKPHLTPKQATQNAESANGLFKTKGVFDNE